MPDDIALREDGSQGNELGDLKVGVLALLKLEVSLPQSEGLLKTTAVTQFRNDISVGRDCHCTLLPCGICGLGFLVK